MALNQVTISGNLTREPEYKDGIGQNGLITLAMANNRRWLKQGTGGNTGIEPVWQEATTYIDVKVWKNGLINQINRSPVTTGTPITVVGRLDLETWETDGQKRQRHVLTVTDGSHDIVLNQKYAPADGAGRTGGGASGAAPAANPFDAGSDEAW